MATPNNPDEHPGIAQTPLIRVPASLSLKDVAFVVAAIVSIVVSWGMYGTRLSLVEQSVSTLKSDTTRIDTLRDKVDALDKKIDSVASDLRHELDQYKWDQRRK